jgi:hypothetical protein
MKTFVRGFILLLLVLWIGGIMFFPIVAATSFTYLPDTHAAGTIVGHCLRVLHEEGLWSGSLIVILLLFAQRYKAVPRSVAAPVIFTLIMLGLTAYSEFSIIPHMEQDRIAAGGAIDAVPASNPYRMDFNRRHGYSEKIEEAVLIGGVVVIFLVAANYPTVEQKA